MLQCVCLFVSTSPRLFVSLLTRTTFLVHSCSLWVKGCSLIRGDVTLRCSEGMFMLALIVSAKQVLMLVLSNPYLHKCQLVFLSAAPTLWLFPDTVKQNYNPFLHISSRNEKDNFNTEKELFILLVSLLKAYPNCNHRGEQLNLTDGRSIYYCMLTTGNKIWN